MVPEECSMSKRKYQSYSKEFKLEAIRLAEDHDKSVAQVSRGIGLRVNQIYKWKQQLEAKQGSAFPVPAQSTPDRFSARLLLS